MVLYCPFYVTKYLLTCFLCLYYKLVYCIINFTSLKISFKMIIQVLFLFASCINFKDFHFETSSVYYKISYTYVILVQNFGQLYSIVLLMQSAYSGFGCFCLFSALQSQDEELIFFSSEKLLRQQEKKWQIHLLCKMKKEITE